ncbi:MAG TPA: DUF1292 domain-containing protein [Bacilli bacterium]|nr:DUF1292 domain-containing protein [Bacilli bacterium]
MEEKKMIKIHTLEGNVEEVEVIIAFQFNDTKKEYMVYTKNEVDEAGNVTVYVSEVMREGSEIKLGGVSTDEEWLKIKDVLRELAKEEAQQ